MVTKTANSRAARLTTICLLAVNLRLGVTAASALIGTLTGQGVLTDFSATLVTSLPVVTFALAGFVLAPLVRHLGQKRSMALALLLLAFGLGIRIAAQDWVIVLGTAVASVGIAFLNTEVPALIKGWFSGSTSRVSTLYATVMALGSATAAAVSLPISTLLDRSEAGLAIWAMPALVALVAWELTEPKRVAPDDVVAGEARDVELPVCGELPSGTWLLTAYFSLQSMTSYVVIGWLPTIAIASGIGAERSGLLLGVIMGIGIPCTVLIVPATATHRGRRIGIAATAASAVVGIAGMILFPASCPEVWSVLIGVGMSGFPIALALISGIGHDAEEVGRVSRIAQSIGYGLAALGPIGGGLIHTLTGSWIPVLLLLGAASVLQGALGLKLSAVISRR